MGSADFLRVALVLAVIYLFPLHWMYLTNLKTDSSIFAVPPEFLPTDPQWSTYAEIRVGPASGATCGTAS